MKIQFEDSSFLEMNKNDDKSISVSMVGFLEHNKTTMLTSILTLKQAEEMLLFLKKVVYNDLLAIKPTKQ